MIACASRGSIINIASLSALSGEGPLAYCATKAALLGMTKCLARDLGPRGIRVNALCPGPTRTPLMQSISAEWQQALERAIPLGHLLEPEEIARVVLGRDDLIGDQRLIYVLDLTRPNGMFMARDFVVRDGDTVYVTEAPYVQWQKTLAAINGSASAASSIGSAAGN